MRRSQRIYAQYYITTSRIMDNSAALPLRPFTNSSFAKTRERAPFSEVLTLKAANIQKVIQMLQRAAQKSCISAFKLMCLPLDSLLCEKVICCSAQPHQPKEDKNTQGALQSLPSNILIVNISNSTLIDCVIGNDAYSSAVTERQPLMQKSEFHMHDQRQRCSCSCGQQGAAQTSPPPLFPPLWTQPPSAENLSISIQGSHLNCVIIGDNNYMHAEQSQPFD